MSWYETPTAMARRLATYISDPSTIRVRVLEYFGRAPSVEKCRKFREDVLAERRRFKEASEAPRRKTPFKCGHPHTHDNITHGDHEQAICKTCRRERDAEAAKRYRARQQVAV